MPRHSFDLTPADVVLILAAALAFLWPKLHGAYVRGAYPRVAYVRGANIRVAHIVGTAVRGRCAAAGLTVTGYFRARPDPAAEAALRAAFAELDCELAAILGDRRPPERLGPLTTR